MGRKKCVQGNSTPPTNISAFRDEERRWKSRLVAPDLSLAFDADNIAWDSLMTAGRLRGIWTSGSGATEECWRVDLDELAELGGLLGQSRWKGKQRQGENDYAIIVPRIPGEPPEPLRSGLVLTHL